MSKYQFNTKKRGKHMAYAHRNIIENYLQHQYGAGEVEDVGDVAWTHDIEAILPDGNKFNIEVKERKITEDYIAEADDLMIEFIQDFRTFSDKDFKKKRFETAVIDIREFHRSLGWIYSEDCDRFIYIKYINTSKYKGCLIYDFDFHLLKNFYVTSIVPNWNKYRQLKNTTQERSKSQSFNLLVPFSDIPDIYIKTGIFNQKK